MTEQLVHRGTLEGHSGWVTSLATSLEKYGEDICANPVVTDMASAQTCSFREVATKHLSFGISRATTKPTVIQSEVFMATLTLYPTVYVSR